MSSVSSQMSHKNFSVSTTGLNVVVTKRNDNSWICTELSKLYTVGGKTDNVSLYQKCLALGNYIFLVNKGINGSNREISIEGEGALPLVQLSINFKKK